MPIGVGSIGMSNAGRFTGNGPTIPSRYLISGVTRNAGNTPLAGCAVDVYETVSKLWRGNTISDANGNYAIEISGDRGITFRVDAYLVGSPDTSGTTVNTLVGA